MEKMKENLKRQYEVIMTTEPKTQLKYHKLLEAVKNLNKKYQKLISKENMINKATDIYNQDGENSRKMYDKYFKEIPALEIDLTKTEEIFKRTFGVREGEHVINKINNKINEYVRNYKMKFLKNDETFWRIDDMDNLEKKPEQWEKMDNVPGIDDDEAVEIEEDSVDLHGRHPTRDDEPYHTVSRDPSRSARTSDPIFDDRVGLHGGPPSGLPSPPPTRYDDNLKKEKDIDKIIKKISARYMTFYYYIQSVQRWFNKYFDQLDETTKKAYSSINDIELKFREDWESIKIIDNEEIIDLLTLLDKRMEQLERIVDYLKTKNPLVERTLDDELELLDVQKQFISDEIDRAQREVKSSYKDKEIIKEYKTETIRKLKDEYRNIQEKRETYEGQTQIRATQTPLTELPPLPPLTELQTRAPLTEQLLEPAGARETVARAGQVPGQRPGQGGGGIDTGIVTQILREITKIIPLEKKENTDKIIELATKLIENNYTVKKASALSNYYLERFKLSAKSLEIIKDMVESPSPSLKSLIKDIVTSYQIISKEYNNLLNDPSFETDAILINLKDNVESYMSIFNTIITNVNEVYTELYKDIRQIMNSSFKIIIDQPSDHRNREIRELIKRMSFADFGDVKKLLFLIKNLNNLNSFGTGILDERAVCGDVDGKKIDGKVCIDIIQKCLSGPGEKCIDAFSKLNLDNGIELRTMDYAIAEQISRQIGFHDKSVGEAIHEIQQKNPKFSISPKLFQLLEAIKARISDVTTKHYTTGISTPRIRNIPLRDINQRRIGLTGGGISMDYYNKFIINVDALKSNLVMKGGGNSVLLKQNIHYLTTLLKNNDKEIAQEDLNSINRLIDTVQVGEEKLKKIKDVIDGFITALNIKKIDISDIPDDPKDPKKVSFDMLTELKDKATKTQGKTLQKVSTCIGLFDFILPQLNSFIVQG